MNTDPAGSTPMPRLGLGVFRAGAGDGTIDAVKHALSVGYRHIDTAAVYRNEAEVGEALRRSDVPREAVFLTTKLWNDDHGYDETLRAFDRSLVALGVEHVDQYLIHWPVPGGRRQSWRALEAIHRSGRARSIGVSNYTPRHLQELLDHSEVRPAVNQVEVHPFLPQTELRAFCADLGIQVVAYSPLTKGRRLDDPVLVGVAERLGCTTAQLLIAWGLAQDLVVVAKSSNPARIDENLAALEVALDESALAELATLDPGDGSGRTAWDPTSVDRRRLSFTPDLTHRRPSKAAKRPPGPTPTPSPS